MSHKTTIYLADVHDHMEYILTSIEMFASISENLINFSFNVGPTISRPSNHLIPFLIFPSQMSSHEMNEVMRTLTIVTVLFVPLTLLTGYFVCPFSLPSGFCDLIYDVCAGYEL